MAEFPARSIVLSLPPDDYEALAALAASEGLVVEEFAAGVIADAVRLGTPGTLHIAARLAAEAAELLAQRWETRRAELARLRAELQRVEAALGRLAAGV
jgi:hypothetical protein